MKKLCIFDFDGTLVDSITDVAICFNNALQHYGFDTHEISTYKYYIGGNLESNVSRMLKDIDRTENNIKLVAAYYRELYLKYEKPNTKPYRDIVRMLQVLRKNGITVTIHTNKAQELVEDLCKKYFRKIEIKKIIGYSPNIPSKPNPDGVLQLLEMCGVTKEEAIYVGDTETDIKTANNAGIDCMYVTWGQGKPSDLEKVQKKFVVNSPLEILPTLQQSDGVQLKCKEAYA